MLSGGGKNAREGLRQKLADSGAEKHEPYLPGNTKGRDYKAVTKKRPLIKYWNDPHGEQTQEGSNTMGGLTEG
jgi:hypothetical protein